MEMNKVDYVSLLGDRLSGCRMCRHLVRLAAAAFLVAEFCGVSSALTDRGEDLCLSRASTPERARVMEKPCVADLLAADAAGRQRVALHLRGNCQGTRIKAMMPSRQEFAEAALEPSPTLCTVVIGS